MSTWRWQPVAYRGELDEIREGGPVCTTLDEAYDLAESWWAEGSRHVAIKLYTPGELSPGLADSRNGERRNGEWVVGRERWRENEAKAARAGRA